jgi:hypothetical protein
VGSWLLAAITGWFRVDGIKADSFPSDHTSRAWGHLIREYDGSVAEEPHPWVNWLAVPPLAPLL